MSHLSRQFVAWLLILWLPLFSGQALAVSIPVVSGEDCHQMAMEQGMSMDMTMDAGMEQQPSVQHDASPCNADGVCHFACCGYLATSPLSLVNAPHQDGAPIPYRVTFSSRTALPLDPPPLA